MDLKRKNFQIGKFRKIFFFVVFQERKKLMNPQTHKRKCSPPSSTGSYGAIPGKKSVLCTRKSEKSGRSTGRNESERD